MGRKLTRTILIVTIIAITTFTGGIFAVKIASPSFQVKNVVNSILDNDEMKETNSQNYSKRGFMSINQDACCGHTDVDAPTIQLSSPANNSISSGNIIIHMIIMDNNPYDENKASEVLYSWNDDTSNTTLDESDDEFFYDVVLPTDLGVNILYVYARDSSGNWASTVFGFIVTGAVTYPPTIDFITPSTSNETLSGIYLFQVSVTDDLGILKVEAQIDQRASTRMSYDDTSGYYYYSYNVSMLSAGTHWLNVTAEDIDEYPHTVRDRINFFIIGGEDGSDPVVGVPPVWSLSDSDLPENITEVELSEYEAESGDIYFMVAVKDDIGISAPIDLTIYGLDDFDPSTDEPDISDVRAELSVSLERSGDVGDWETYEYTWDSTASVDRYYVCEFVIQDTDEIAHHLYIRVILETDNVRDQPSSVDIGGAPGFEVVMAILALSSSFLTITLIKRKRGNKNN